MMDIEKLEMYSGTAANIEALKEEIEALYTPISSPNGHTGEGHSSTPGAPTERAAMRIIQLKQNLEYQTEQMLNLREEIETWLVSVKDTEIQAIVRWRYLIPNREGKARTWRDVNLRVYGYPDHWYSRNRLKRYLEREEKKC